MAYYHYQCQHCFATTYLYDDGKNDGIVEVGACDDCGCSNCINDFCDDDDDWFDD